VTAHLRPGLELDKVEREVAEWDRFRALTGQIEQVNEAICDDRPPLPQAAGPTPGTEGQTGSASGSPRRQPPRELPWATCLTADCRSD
jgi:hypothetical protein